MSRHTGIADELDRFAAYLKLDGQDGRARGYERAARNIRMNGYVPPDPTAITGVGDTIREQIATYQHSGEIDELAELEEQYPWFEDLRHVDHIGPARAKQIHDKFSVESFDDLILVGQDLTLLNRVGEKRARAMVESARELRDSV